MNKKIRSIEKILTIINFIGFLAKIKTKVWTHQTLTAGWFYDTLNMVKKGRVLRSKIINEWSWKVWTHTNLSHGTR